MESGGASQYADIGSGRQEGELKQSVSFFVDGNPVPKQSYRAVKGGGYTDPRVTAWSRLVSQHAMIAMAGKEMFTGLVNIEFQFFLPDKRRKDWDNLSKAICDALNGIVYKDDSQVVMATIEKAYEKDEPGVYVLVEGDKP